LPAAPAAACSARAAQEIRDVVAGHGKTPYAGVIQLPGFIQAENFDNGGEGIAYHDTSAGNTGGAYRTDNVDIETTGDTGGGYDIGWTDVGGQYRRQSAVDPTWPLLHHAHATSSCDGCTISPAAAPIMLRIGSGEKDRPAAN
jgi:hypothetical protein